MLINLTCAVKLNKDIQYRNKSFFIAKIQFHFFLSLNLSTVRDCEYEIIYNIFLLIHRVLNIVKKNYRNEKFSRKKKTHQTCIKLLTYT